MTQETVQFEVKKTNPLYSEAGFDTQKCSHSGKQFPKVWDKGEVKKHQKGSNNQEH